MYDYLIFHPSYPGLVWAEVTETGETTNDILAHIIRKMRDGIFTDKGFNLRCVPNIRNKEHPRPKGGWLVAKKKHCKTLGQLFAPKEFKGSQSGLRAISEKDRYKGKVDWEAERPQITNWLSGGWSLWKIAKQLDTSPSTLSEANKRYGLYETRKSVREQMRDSA